MFESRAFSGCPAISSQDPSSNDPIPVYGRWHPYHKPRCPSLLTRFQTRHQSFGRA